MGEDLVGNGIADAAATLLLTSKRRIRNFGEMQKDESDDFNCYAQAEVNS
jgi:hypothetical protein